MPFRDAHAVVGALVRRSLEEGVALAELVAAAPELGPDAVGLLGRGVAVRRRTTPGGAGPAALGEQQARMVGRLAADHARLSDTEA
jgi:argininosuccinate lyase